MCHNVTIEPTLQPVLPLPSLTLEQDQTLQLMVFWGGHFEKTFFDVRVLNPLAPSNTTPTPMLATADMKKKNKEHMSNASEHASFTPIVLSTTGGMGPIATTFYKHLADRLASKWNTSYSQTTD